MFKSLRSRLVLSHVLPFLILLPLLGAALAYFLETRLLLPQLIEDLSDQARLLAEITTIEYDPEGNPFYYEFVLDRIQPDPDVRVNFLSPRGQLLYTSDQDELEMIGQFLNLEGMQQALSGETALISDYSGILLPFGSLEVLQPVYGMGRQPIGVLRLGYPNAAGNSLFLQLRNLIAVVLIAGLGLGIILALVLAFSIDRPVSQVTSAIYEVAAGKSGEPLIEHGPQEMRDLVRSVNYLVERLHSLEVSRKQLLANLVHELGRPLGALRSAIQALAKGAADDPKLLNDLTTGMDAETRRLQRLVEDLAQLHTQDFGMLELHREPVALSEWLPVTLQPWQQAAAEKGLVWENDLPAGLPILQADPGRLAQIVGNLVSNAIKFTPAGGTVAVSSGVGQAEVFIRVRDTGAGIPAADLEKIYTPYFRGSQGRRIKQGMGLGLTIARELTIAHGGRIDVESQPNAGSTFTAWFPLQNA